MALKDDLILYGIIGVGAYLLLNQKTAKVIGHTVNTSAHAVDTTLNVVDTALGTADYIIAGPQYNGWDPSTANLFKPETWAINANPNYWKGFLGFN